MLWMKMKRFEELLDRYFKRTGDRELRGSASQISSRLKILSRRLDLTSRSIGQLLEKISYLSDNYFVYIVQNDRKTGYPLSYIIKPAKKIVNDMTFNWVINRSFIDYPPYITTLLGFRYCNLDCSFCSNWQYLNKVYQEIRLDQIEKILDSDPTIEAITMGGGEPSLSIPLMKEAIRIARSRDKKISVQTNGLLINKIKDLDIDLFQIDLKLHLRMGVLKRTIKYAKEFLPSEKYKFTTVLFENHQKLNRKLEQLKKLTEISILQGRPDLTRFPDKFLP